MIFDETLPPKRSALFFKISTEVLTPLSEIFEFFLSSVAAVVVVVAAVILSIPKRFALSSFFSDVVTVAPNFLALSSRRSSIDSSTNLIIFLSGSVDETSSVDAIGSDCKFVGSLIDEIVRFRTTFLTIGVVSSSSSSGKLFSAIGDEKSVSMSSSGVGELSNVFVSSYKSSSWNHFI